MQKLFDIFDKIDINCNECNEYKPRSSNMINRKNELSQYLKTMKYKLTHIIRKINNSNFKSSVRYK